MPVVNKKLFYKYGFLFGLFQIIAVKCTCEEFLEIYQTDEERTVFNDEIKIISSPYVTEFKKKYAEQSRNYSGIFKENNYGLTLKSARTLTLTHYNYSSFPGLAKIYEYLTVLEKLSKGSAVVVPLREYNVSWSVVSTYFGNEILSIRISSQPTRVHELNPIIVVVAGIHGRDWYAVQSAVFLATELIVNENRRTSDWWIIPVLNPDGYDLTHVESKWRNWEKNLEGLEDVSCLTCFGVDLDFSFEYQWLDCNDNDCDPNFPGKLPFSVSEARGLRDTLEAFSDRFDFFVALKEGKQSLVYPFSDTLKRPRNFRSIDKMSKEALEAFSKRVEGLYTQGQSSHLLEPQAGFIEDWAKIHLGIEKSFAFYLGPTEKNRRELNSQHLMDHMLGTYDLLISLTSAKINENYVSTPRSSSFPTSSSLTYILPLSFFILHY